MLEFSDRVDLCYPFNVNDYIFMQLFPKEQSRLSATIKPFDYEANHNNFFFADAFKTLT